MRHFQALSGTVGPVAVHKRANPVPQFSDSARRHLLARVSRNNRMPEIRSIAGVVVHSASTSAQADRFAFHLT